MTTDTPGIPPALHYPPQGELSAEARSRSPQEAAAFLSQYPPHVIASALAGLNPAMTLDILEALPPESSDAVMAAVSPAISAQWRLNRAYPKDSIGRLMGPAYAVFKAEMTVAQTIERLRSLVKNALITYGYIIDESGRLAGLVTMRDLLFAQDQQRLQDVMLRNVFQLNPGMPLNDAMKLVLDPWRFDVVVTTNLFGDILSDLVAGLVGGLGMAPGANIGADAAIFEAVHGSAPDIAGKGIANPTAVMLAAAMMLDHCKLTDLATRLRLGIEATLNVDQVRTGDLGGSATTAQYAQALAARIRNG